jgi:uncharacterized protein YdhG (YjbR/CyaY superfamily)
MKKTTAATRRSAPRKAKTATRRPAAEGMATAGPGPAKTVDDYLARAPEPARSALKEMRAIIRSVVPPETTETISYQMPAYKYKGTLVWFAAFRDHCSLFPTAATIEAFKDDLAGYTTSKGTIQFPLDKPLPTALIKKLVKARVAQIESKKR